MDWIGGIKFAMGALAKLGRGKATLGDRTFAIEGEAATPDTYAELLAASAQPLPAGLTGASSNVVPPRISPYRLVIEPGPGTVRLTGYVASQNDRQALLAAVTQKFGAAQILDNLAYGSGAPPGFLGAAKASLQALSRLAGGGAQLLDTTLRVTGDAYYPNAVEEILDALSAATPDAFKVDAAVGTRQDEQPVSAGACRDMLQAVLQTGGIEFDGNRSDITSDSYGVLDRVAATLARCPDARIEIGAHSDSEGSASRNRDRTQSRAEAIVDFLVSAGIKRERLTAVGYGESKPIADNGTAQGRAANRRIEFTVALPEGG
jgi:OOP family OmpA-OmpF porin